MISSEGALKIDMIITPTTSTVSPNPCMKLIFVLYIKYYAIKMNTELERIIAEIIPIFIFASVT